jgi:hypothetical protein
VGGIDEGRVEALGLLKVVVFLFAAFLCPLFGRLV